MKELTLGPATELQMKIFSKAAEIKEVGARLAHLTAEMADLDAEKARLNAEGYKEGAEEDLAKRKKESVLSGLDLPQGALGDPGRIDN